MALTVYNTLSRSKEAFVPGNPERVTMYVCGPTVYSFPHIGNARPAVVFDVLARLLRRRFRLVYARNITDVDDKINAAAIAASCGIGDIAARYTDAYHQDMAALGVLPPDVEPTATAHIGDMLTMIGTLIGAGHAYAAEGHVLFRVKSFPGYGQLSRRGQRELLAGARVEVAPYKEDAGDFVLWKPSTPEQPGWDSPWGRGRPGWHIECSAMAARHLGETIDIHGGGNDLIFPHHENELAQSSCAHQGATFSRYWMHNGFLNVDHTKMSKSLGNVLLVRELLEQAPGEAVRLALLAAHYRQPLDWSGELLAQARRNLDRLYGTLRDVAGWEDDWPQAEPDATFMAALEDDLNTPRALAALFDLARDANRSEDAAARCQLAARLRASGEVLGLLGAHPEAWFTGAGATALSNADVERLLAARREARARRDFAAADRIRGELAAAGISIEDGPDGTRWRRSG
ncbi:MAG: cysteine--tRNA ligase [Gammaproteobacteria bacterium]|nr:MAG: cysteine--tRNA ligase [Pseudomonadota bacterium]MBC6945674.1 cysteine--tRNA ligase [Gammaproteobacteria bacterium]MCE7896369.1 cysteine--tRNA ligase [Gammaproteobacteria bacterium PRO8]MDL1881401.1 cysteine--tRNA ligase [Gammaproteobacteria bacterium PRO2]MCL4777894.1 cysteine--tRNA ligase [Gammaproteobacteria bacterium]